MAGSKSSPSSRLLSQLQDYLSARVGPAERLCVGLSGGRDSVVLLHLLARSGLGSRLSAIHVHHGLSPNAEAWTSFCENFCCGLDVPLQVQRVAVADGEGLGLEAAARNARYEAFSRCAADCLLLAHHQGDQAETVLFNLIRGSGIAGAAGIPAERRLGGLRLLRPLLGVLRAEIEAYARENDLAWIDDESNDNTGFSRNFLRHEVLPVIEGRFPGASSCIATAAAHFAEADVLLADLAELDWASCAEGDCLPMARLRCLSPIRLKNLLRYRLRCLGWRAPAARRLDEFVRQLLHCAPDTHPSLDLPDGRMKVAGRRLCWIGQGISL
ncbi:MAG TPA: tRNA lysidine(34) synthetase TilS [Rhodocyclaceae bacterium]|nr:tRNA lysidine(34) synthetase TilS [Rhodocyclaceae bacterium]